MIEPEILRPCLEQKSFLGTIDKPLIPVIDLQTDKYAADDDQKIQNDAKPVLIFDMIR